MATKRVLHVLRLAREWAKNNSKINRLTVLSVDESFRSTVIKCQCDCGTVKTFLAANVAKGYTKSCGCLNIQRIIERTRVHGKTGTPEYAVWAGMLCRCYTKSSTSYRWYGARGISVCDRWRHSFGNFLADMGQRPDGYTIERIDSRGNYEPSNCRWATSLEQSANVSSNHILTFNGESHHIAEWARICGISEYTILRRVVLGWSIEDTLTKPVRTHKPYSRRAVSPRLAETQAHQAG